MSKANRYWGYPEMSVKRLTCLLLSLAALPAFAAPPEVAVTAPDCLPLEYNRAVTASVSPEVAGSSVRLYFRRLNPVGAFYYDEMFASGEGGYWTEFDWDKAATLGSEAVGLAYSGEYGFADTVMFWPITHMVAPAQQALQCVDCHRGDSCKRCHDSGGPAKQSLDHVASCSNKEFVRSPVASPRRSSDSSGPAVRTLNTWRESNSGR